MSNLGCKFLKKEEDGKDAPPEDRVKRLALESTDKVEPF